MRLYFGGGLNEAPSPHLYEAAEGSYNFRVAKDNHRLEPRPPFDLEGTAPNGADVRGLMQLVKRDDTQSTLVQAGAQVYKWDGASTFSSMGTTLTSSQLRDCTWSLDDYLVITDLQKLEVVKKWDGTTFSTLTTGLGTSLYAKYGVVHRGRVWLFNVKTSTDTPHLMVASAFETPTSYDTTNRAGSATFTSGNEAFYMLTPDLRPINGVALFQDRLIVSTAEGRLYILSGTNSKDYAWTDFYVGSQAIGNESLANIGNDVVYMRKGGNIESLRSTEKFGDIAADDLSRWIPNAVKNLTAAITVYDQTNQLVLFFIADKVLVLSKDVLIEGALLNEEGAKAKLSPWSVYKTEFTSGYNTSAARYMRAPGTTNHSVYFGDSAGRIFDFNGTGISGDAGSQDIQVIRKSKPLKPADGLDPMRGLRKCQVNYWRVGENDFSVTAQFAEEYGEDTASMSLEGPASAGAYFGGSIYFGGASYFGEGAQFADLVSMQKFSLVGRGSACVMTASVIGTNDFSVDSLDLG